MLSDGRKRLDAAIRRAAPAVWDWDAASRTFLASEGLRALYDLEPSAPLGLDEYISVIHPDDRLVLRQLFEESGGSSFPQRVIYRVPGDSAEAVRWHSAELEFRGGTNGEVGLTGTVRDVSSQRESERALAESEERLHLAMEAGRLAIYEIELDSGRLTGSAELNRLYGLPFDARPTLADLRAHYAPGELERLEKEGVTYERAAAAVGQEQAADDPNRKKVEAELTIVTPAGITKHLEYRAQYVPRNDDVDPRLIGVLVDVSDRKRAEHRLTVVADELHHRLKNTLAVVHSIAYQTFRSGEAVEASLRAFLARLQALGAATAALLWENTDEFSLEELVQLITEPYRSAELDPFAVSGDPVRISGKLATSLAMALHELSTNAIKHGALSRPGGGVSVAWHVSEGGMLELRWQEKGGPAVTPPSRRGFGSRLLSTLIPYGSVAQDFAPAGLLCVIKCKLDPGR